MTDSALTITVDDVVYDIRLANLTAIDAKDFRAAVGVSLAQAISDGSLDLDIVAGLIWLVRRQRERGLAYSKVAKEITYESNLDFSTPDAEVVDDSPEI